MYPTITVNQAISRAHKMVTIPFVCIIVIAVVFSCIVIKWITAILFVPFGILLGLIGALIYRGVMITKWRLWAFENVDRPNELKRKAIQYGWVKDDRNKFFAKLEIASTEQKHQWELLQTRFQTPDFFSDNPELPYETIIYYSKIKKGMLVLLYLISLCFGLLEIFWPKSNPYSIGSIWAYIFGALIVIGMAYLIYITIKDMMNDKPQIILNNEGIQTAGSGFHSWGEITNEKMEIRGSGRTTSFHLTYHYKSGYEDVLMDSFTITYNKLGDALKGYRERYENRSKRSDSHVRGTSTGLN